MNSFDPVTVLIVGPTTRLHDLDACLPEHWMLLRRTELSRTELSGESEHPDIVLLLDPSAAAVTSACLQHPIASVIAVLGPFSDHGEVVRVLDAGADACVRTTNAAIVAAHVEACHRRQLPQAA